MDVAVVVQVGERPTSAPEDPEHVGDVGRADALEAGAHGLARHPPAEVPGTALALRGPVMKRGGNGGMAAVPEPNSLGVQPAIVRGVGRGDESERASEPVDDLLIMPEVAGNPLASPAPPWRELPPGDVRRECPRDAALAGGRAGQRHRVC